MTDGALIAALIALYYLAAAIAIGRHEWRRHRWLSRAKRFEVTALAAAAWPWFVWMGVRDERGPWCLVESFRGDWWQDADERIVARYWTEHGAERVADSMREGRLEANVGIRVARCDRLDWVPNQ